MTTQKSNGSTVARKPGSDESGIVILDEISQLSNIDVETEVATMVENIPPSLVRVRIDHSPSGRHRMFIDNGDSYGVDQEDQVDVPNNVFTGIVVYSQTVSALWVEGEQIPRYSAIDGKVTSRPGSEIHASQAKDKARLFVLTFLDSKPQLVVFNLSPTSIKHWRNHVQRLARSKAPAIAVVTRFSLDDIQRNSYRWAEIKCSVERVVTQDELDIAMSLRDECRQTFGVIVESDFDDPGDRVSGEDD
ncbi:MAG TPA: hypothetical protein ENH10_00725 [Bacteroidetes bacterium]|nr:hypothetical protein BMS3Bbin04_01849 [bacterium BMS3Bbin04]HDO64544.1 hypothetical protein [Bacteroidota bacterium]HEX03669.1 hypothetical protein [Bacteroidota bacterium]